MGADLLPVGTPVDGPHWPPGYGEAEIGMLVVETIAKIRRAYFFAWQADQGDLSRAACVTQGGRKVIRSNATEFHYERTRQPLPTIGPWRERLDSLLEDNEGKSARERLTLVRLYEELCGLGYDGSYAAVRRYAIGWRTRALSRRVGLARAGVTRPPPIPLRKPYFVSVMVVAPEKSLLSRKQNSAVEARFPMLS